MSNLDPIFAVLTWEVELSSLSGCFARASPQFNGCDLLGSGCTHTDGMRAQLLPPYQVGTRRAWTCPRSARQSIVHERVYRDKHLQTLYLAGFLYQWFVGHNIENIDGAFIAAAAVTIVVTTPAHLHHAPPPPPPPLKESMGRPSTVQYRIV